MTENIPNSKFFQFIEVAFKEDNYELIKSLYSIRDYITDDLVIDCPANIEILEKIVRILTDVDIQYNILQGKFFIQNVPEDKEDYIRWFIKLFAFLESEVSNWELSEKDLAFLPNKNHIEVFLDPRITVELNISELRFLYDNIFVEII